jgi:hypothetical protein
MRGVVACVAAGCAIAAVLGLTSGCADFLDAEDTLLPTEVSTMLEGASTLLEKASTLLGDEEEEQEDDHEEREEQVFAGESSTLLEAASTLLLFSGIDGWRYGAFAHDGLLWSPGGLNHPGFVLKLLLGGGVYTYLSGALGGASVRGRHYLLTVLPGVRVKVGNWDISAFLGADVQYHVRAPPDPGSHLNGLLYGARLAVDVWYQPQPWLMLQTNASLASIGSAYSLRAAAGFRLLELAFVGPEAQALGCLGEPRTLSTVAVGCDADDGYRQWRAGLHVTALRTGPFEWSAAIGWAGDSDRRSGIYGRLSVFTRR